MAGMRSSGEEALVRLAGPTSGMVQVPDRAVRKVDVRGGTYQIFVRYGEPGKYRYTRGEPFTIIDNGREYEEMTITLHKVAGGNYESSPSNEKEFNGGRGSR